MDARRYRFLMLLTAEVGPMARKSRETGLKPQVIDRRKGVDRRRPSWAA